VNKHHIGNYCLARVPGAGAPYRSTPLYNVQASDVGYIRRGGSWKMKRLD